MQYLLRCLHSAQNRVRSIVVVIVVIVVNKACKDLRLTGLLDYKNCNNKTNG